AATWAVPAAGHWPRPRPNWRWQPAAAQSTSRPRRARHRDGLIGHFHDHRIDHRQVGGDGNAVIEEAGVLQPAILAVDVFLVDRPADALGSTALILAFDLAWMDRLAGILHNCVARHHGAARLLIHLGIDDVGCEADARALGIDLVMAGDGTAGRTGILGDVG